MIVLVVIVAPEIAGAVNAPPETIGEVRVALSNVGEVENTRLVLVSPVVPVAAFR